MNLAQSVGIFCHALSTITPDPRPHDRPPAALVERLHDRAEALLLEAGFLHQNNPDRIYDDLRAMAGRAELDAREVTILLGIVRQLEWALRATRSSDADDSGSR
jgi:tRNA/rRNA methyltransferase